MNNYPFALIYNGDCAIIDSNEYTELRIHDDTKIGPKYSVYFGKSLYITIYRVEKGPHSQVAMTMRLTTPRGLNINSDRILRNSGSSIILRIDDLLRDNNYSMEDSAECLSILRHKDSSTDEIFKYILDSVVDLFDMSIIMDEEEIKLLIMENVIN